MARILRAGLYERVSTDEQKLKGYSIAAQKDNLEEYCQKNRMKIVDHYTDEGISGSKPPLKRPDLKRLLDDVEAGRIDIILFTKLDRWFRSVKEYFKVQEILDDNKVEWKAIHENYDTTTANGQMAITIFLAVAQNERDRTAERIKTVIDHKLRNREACFSYKSIPMGYKKEPDENGIQRLVKDPETQQAVQEFWDILLESNNLNKAIRHVTQNYDITREWQSWSRMTQSDFYCGIHKGVQDFCEPYVSPEKWLKYNQSKPIKATPSGRIYLFRGLIRCEGCGRKLSGSAQTYHGRNAEYKGTEYKSYRCNARCKTCDNPTTVAELRLETHLLDNLEKYLETEIALAEVEINKPVPKPKININKLKERRRRLEIVYLAGNKTDDEYFKEDAELKLAIEKAEKEKPPEPRDITPLKEMLETDFRSLYEKFDDEEKQQFWLSLIKEIIVKNKKIKRVKFFN